MCEGQREKGSWRREVMVKGVEGGGNKLCTVKTCMKLSPS